MITNRIIIIICMILLVWDVRNAATCRVFFLSLLIRTDTSSCFFGYCWIFFFDICHVVNIKFIGWYIMYFCHPIFFYFKNLQRGISITILYCSSCSTANRIQKQKQNRIITHTEVTTDGWRQFSKQWRVLVGSLFCCFGKTGSCRREKLAWRCLKLLCP